MTGAINASKGSFLPKEEENPAVHLRWGVGGVRAYVGVLLHDSYSE